jgi:hypothetical protein
MFGCQNNNNRGTTMIVLAKRFEAAVRVLVGDGPVKQRLGQAYARHLQDLQQDDLPDAMHARYEDLQAAMHRKATPMGGANSIRIAVQKMSFAQASAYAETILELYAELLRSAERSEPLKIVRSEDAPPRYLVGRS